jgi:agmatinase
MPDPFDYPSTVPHQFGGVLPPPADPDAAAAIVLPLPLDRTTSYASGTRNGPREILEASTHMELWDEELGAEICAIGLHTLPSMDFPKESLAETLDDIRKVADAILSRGAFLVALGGEHSITGPLVAAAAARTPGLSILQIDAHADQRDEYTGTRFSHACAMRRALEHASRCTQVGIRSLSTQEAAAIPDLPTRVFYDWDMRDDPDWIDRVVDSLTDDVYLTIDLDGLDPAIMPSVGTPEPGGLSWYECLALLRKVAARRRLVACDVVELCPVPGLLGPNFLAAKLVYKILGYRFRDRLLA